jgi:leucyl-tRNA synthetase
MFMGPYDQDVAWDVSSVGGVYRFLTRVWNLGQDYLARGADPEPDPELLQIQHKTIKKVTEDLHRAGFNTAVAALMEYLNALTKTPDRVTRENIETLLKLLAPFAPHLSAELFEQLSNKTLIDAAGWPEWEEEYLVSDTMVIAVQVNGKLRGEITVATDAPQAEIEKQALKQDNVAKFIGNQKPARVIYVPGKIVNIVI